MEVQMTELESALQNLWSDGLYKIILSNAIKKESEGVAYRKVVLNRKTNGWQAEQYTEKQVFHENLKADQVRPFVEQALEAQGISMKIQMQISIAVEEIYVNIARYAYHPEIGQATVRCAVGGNPLQVTIQFLDSGKPFDPLAKPDADTTLSAEERDIGGLGILMVKKSMDDVVYEYRDGCNILTLMKRL